MSKIMPWVRVRWPSTAGRMTVRSTTQRTSPSGDNTRYSRWNGARFSMASSNATRACSRSSGWSASSQASGLDFHSSGVMPNRSAICGLTYWVSPVSRSSRYVTAGSRSISERYCVSVDWSSAYRLAFSIALPAMSLRSCE